MLIALVSCSVLVAFHAMVHPDVTAFATFLPGTPLRRADPGVPDRRWLASGILANAASAFAHRSPVGSLATGREVGLQGASMAVRERMWAVGDALIGRVVNALGIPIDGKGPIDTKLTRKVARLHQRKHRATLPRLSMPRWQPATAYRRSSRACGGD